MPIDHLPAPWRPPVRRFRDWLATDHGVILGLALFFTSRAMSYRYTPPELLQHIIETAPMWASPAIWGTGAALLWAALLPKGCRIDTIALTAAVIVMALWGVLFLWSSPAIFLLRGTPYIALAGFTIYTVWRGRSGTIRTTGGDNGHRP